MMSRSNSNGKGNNGSGHNRHARVSSDLGMTATFIHPHPHSHSHTHSHSHSTSASNRWPSRTPSPSKPMVLGSGSSSSSSTSSSTTSASTPSSVTSQPPSFSFGSYDYTQQYQYQPYSHPSYSLAPPPSFTYHAPTPSRFAKQSMHSLTLSVEPMRSVPSPVAATLSPVAAANGGSTSPISPSSSSSPGAMAMASGADWSRTHGHSRQNSLAASRKPSFDVEEKPQPPSLSRIGTPVYSSSARVPSPLTGPAHFPPAWSHHIYGGEAQCPPRSRPPVAELVVRAIRERFSGNSKSGALGRGLMLGWVITTLGFVAATAFWKGELFTALDRLSKSLYDMGYQGLIVFGVLIFITTIPPLPLYSTLIVLSGYTFGVWNGFVASYLASLVGAVVVFIVSRTLLRDAVTRSLASSPTATSLLQIIPQNPHLLLLIRIAPYPYNLLNVVLASAPSLTLQTYTCCTAISLCKLVLHTWIGAGIRDISAAYTTPSHPSTGDTPAAPPPELTPEDIQHERVKAGVTWGGIILCCVLFVYLTHVAKRAIAKAQEGQRVVREEEVAFLTPMGDARDLDSE